jgi:1-acyl-sn-glycerol-3-phosphate acyltransferase
VTVHAVSQPRALGATPLIRHFSFLLLWSSVAASGFGDRLIQLVAWEMLGIQLEGAQASSVSASVTFAFFAPYLIGAPLGGWLADRLPRKWLLLTCDEGRAAALFLAMILVPTGATALPPEHHWKLYAVVASVGLLAAVFSPTKLATVPLVVETEQLQAANAVVLGVTVIASLIGLWAGGWLIKAQSLRLCLTVAIASFAVSGTFFAFMKTRPQHLRRAPDQPPRPSPTIRALAYLRTHRRIAELVALNVLWWAGAYVFLAAVAALCKNRFGFAGPQLTYRIAVMSMWVGLGMLAGSLAVVWTNSRRESAWVGLLALLASAGLMLALAGCRSYPMGLALAFGAGFFGNLAMICVATLSQVLTPDFMRGRVFGCREMLSTATAAAVNLTIWIMPQADGWMIPALATLSLVLGVLAVVGLWLQMTVGPLPKRHWNALWRLCRAYALAWHRLRWAGRHHVPVRGAVILAANHTTGLDPLLIQAAIPRLIRWVMLREYRFSLLQPLWDAIQPIAVGQGGGDFVQLRQALRALRAGQLVGIFPEGGAQREHRELQPFQPGVALLARRSGAPIVPVWIQGTPRVRHMFWHFAKPSRTRMIFGQPFKPDPALSNQQVIDELRHRMLSLKPQA